MSQSSGGLPSKRWTPGGSRSPVSSTRRPAYSTANTMLCALSLPADSLLRRVQHSGTSHSDRQLVRRRPKGVSTGTPARFNGLLQSVERRGYRHETSAAKHKPFRTANLSSSSRHGVVVVDVGVRKDDGIDSRNASATADKPRSTAGRRAASQAGRRRKARPGRRAAPTPPRSRAPPRQTRTQAPAPSGCRGQRNANT